MKISVVIPAYNAGKYIGRTIDSVLAQTRSADEIIVVDDGSTDNTADVIRRYGEKVKYIHQANAGASVARNTGIKAACGEWIAFLDGDDEWVSEKLRLQVEHLERNPELVWTCANFYSCLCSENRRAAAAEPSKAKKILGDKEYFEDYLGPDFAKAAKCTDTMLIKKEVLEQAGMFRVGQVRSNDTDMWLRIAYRWPRIGYISEPLAIYHLSIPQSITHKHKQIQIRRALFERHLKLAAEHGRGEAFKQSAGRSVTSWIRAMLFSNQPEEIKGLMDQFGEMLTKRFKIIVRLLLIWPWGTALVCHAISRVVRALRLRRKVMRRPETMSK